MPSFEGYGAFKGCELLLPVNIMIFCNWKIIYILKSKYFFFLMIYL